MTDTKYHPFVFTLPLGWVARTDSGSVVTVLMPRENPSDTPFRPNVVVTSIEFDEKTLATLKEETLSLLSEDMDNVIEVPTLETIASTESFVALWSFRYNVAGVCVHADQYLHAFGGVGIVCTATFALADVDAERVSLMEVASLVRLTDDGVDRARADGVDPE